MKFSPWKGLLFFTTVLSAFSASASESDTLQSYKTITGEECQGFNNYLNKFMGYPFIPDDTVSSIDGRDRSYGLIKLPNEKSSEPRFLDFNNDGKDDTVFTYEGGGKYILGSIIYVFYHPKQPKHELVNLAVDDLTVFPCQFDYSSPKSSACPTFSQSADEAGILFPSDKGDVFFRGRYTDIQILSKNEETYLLLRSTSLSSIDYAAVIKPKNKMNYEPICLFKR